MSQGDKRPRRLTLHRWVDGAALIVLLALSLTGALLRWSSPPGRCWIKEIHFCLAEGFVGIMGLHLLLHWRWVAVHLLGAKRGGQTSQGPWSET